MLVLRRKRGQSIIIGEDEKIIIKILKEEEGVITLGIDAPRSLLIDREEVRHRKEDEIKREINREKGNHRETEPSTRLFSGVSKGGFHVNA